MRFGRREEASALVVVTVIGTAMLMLNSRSPFTGPDADTYDQQADAAGSLDFWLSPESLGENYWPPGLPAIRALLLLISTEPGFLKLTQMAAAIGISLCAWRLSRHLGRFTRFLVFAGVLFSPATQWMANNSGYEIWLSLFLTLSLALVWPGASPTWQPVTTLLVLGSGLCWGVAFLVQGKSLAVLPVLVVLAWKYPPIQRLVFLAGAGALPLLWLARNLIVVGQWHVVSTNGPINVWIGNNPSQVTGAFMDPPPLSVGPIGPLDIYITNALNWFVSAPEAATGLTLNRIARLATPVFPQFSDVPPEVSTMIKFVGAGFTLGSLALFLAFAFGRLWLRPPALPSITPIMFFVLAYWVVHLPFLAEPRFLAPTAPLVTAVAIPTGVALAVRHWPTAGSVGKSA